jgi:hypothetical protein
VVVHKWMGHTEAVARKHSLMPLESNFQEATVKRTTRAVGGGDQNPHQNSHHTLTHQHSQEMSPRGESVKNTEKEWQSVLMTLCDFLEVPPTGLEDGVQTLDNTNALVESDAKNDAIYADLIELLSRWPTLPAQVRAKVMALICSD